MLLTFVMFRNCPNSILENLLQLSSGDNIPRWEQQVLLYFVINKSRNDLLVNNGSMSYIICKKKAGSNRLR
jgi:hypothetical protein